MLEALQEGRVDGSCYEGECACLVGTIARARGVQYDAMSGITPDAMRPAERWFSAIRRGDTPATSQHAAIAARWIEEWIQERDGRRP